MRPVSYVALTVAMATMPLSSGCHVCRFRSISATLPARLEINGQVNSPSLAGAVGDGQIAQDSYDRLERAISDASRPAVAQGIIWMLDQGLATDAMGFLAFHLAVPVQRGDVIPAAFLPRFGGWGAPALGPRPPLPGTPIGVYLERGSFMAATATGTVRVLETAPLRLHVDLTFRNAAGDTTIGVQGDMRFDVTSEERICSFE